MELKAFITVFLTISLAISCAKVNFNNAPSASCSAADSCVSNPSGETLAKKLVVPYPNTKVDILFVVDNSRTMLDEQSKIATRLQGFLNTISNLDWRIAITTTDNMPAANTNLYSPQDYRMGELVPFLTSANGGSYATQNGNKIYFITKSTANASTLFYNTVKRPESMWCAGNPFTDCGKIISGDERGIYSAVKNISANSHSFMRSDAQLHVILISDEDERSNSGKGLIDSDGDWSQVPASLPVGDRPEDILNTFKSLNKRAKFHSIVGLPAGFNYNSFNLQACINGHGQTGEEFTGCNYLKASIDSEGIVGNKDVNDYTSILSTIGTDVQDTSISRFSFNCVPSQITVEEVAGKPYPNNLTSPQQLSSSGHTYIDFSPALTAGMEVMITWTCPRI